MTTHLRTLRLIALLSAMIPAAASAQFGGMMNKAKEKMAQKGADQMTPVAPGEQVTEEMMTKVLAGIHAADRDLDQRDALLKERAAKSKQLSEMMEKNEPARLAWQKSDASSGQCRSDAFRAINADRGKQLEEKQKALLSDPKALAQMQIDMLAYQRARTDAMNRKDAAALAKIDADFRVKAVGMDILAPAKKDTVAVEAKCGKAPPLPASVQAEDDVRKQEAALDERIRGLEDKAVKDGAEASGLEQIRYLALKERVGGILKKLDGQGAAKFGDDEMAAVRKRQDDLRKLSRAL